MKLKQLDVPTSELTDIERLIQNASRKLKSHRAITITPKLSMEFQVGDAL